MTAPGSGIGSVVGSGIEAAGSYGTVATIGQWHPFDTFEVKQAPVFFKGQGLHGNSTVPYGSEVYRTNMDAGGTAVGNLYYNKMNRFLASLMGTLGTTSGTEISSSLAYTWTHALTNTWHQSLSFQQLIPDVGQTLHPWNVLGAKFTQGQFECSAGNPLKATWTIDAQDRFEAGSVTSPTDPVGSPFFTWRDMVVKVGTFGSEAQVDGVSKWTGVIKRTQADKRFNAGNLTTNPNLSYGIKDEPAINGFDALTGTLETEYLNDTLFENYYQTDTPFSLIVAFTSTVNAGTSGSNKYSITFASPQCRFTQPGGDPTVSGPDIVKPSMPYEVYNDGTHAPTTITVVNSDATL